MSNPYLFDLSDSSYNYISKIKKIVKKSRHEKNHTGAYFLHYEPVDQDWEVILRGFVKDCEFPFEAIPIPRKWPDNVRSALRKLFLALDGYLIAVDFKPFLNLQDLLQLATSLEGTKILKKFRKDAFLNKFNLESFTSRTSVTANSAGEIFNYRYCINYITEPDDWLLGQLPVKINKSTLEEFESVIEDLLPDSFEINNEEIELALKLNLPCNSSMCIDDNYDYQSICTGVRKLPKNIEPMLDGKRVIIPISAENCRDAVMFTPETSSMIKTLDELIMRMFSHNKHFTMIKDKELFLKRIRDFKQKHSFFVCFDFEKEGITKPRELILSILKVINKAFPCEFFQQCIKLYSSYNVYWKGEHHQMLRGHGLGMANALTSIVILGILGVTVERIQSDVNTSIKTLDFDILSFNDDTTISINEDYFINFEEYFYDVTEELSCRYKREKTFWGKQFVFCEEYSDESFNNKIPYYYSALYTSLMCQNVTEAKHFISSINFPEVLDDVLYSVLTHFGYEFYETEIQEPICFGGWFSRGIFGVDTSWYTKTDFSIENLAALRASGVKAKRKKARDHPILGLNPEPLLFHLPEIERLHGKRYQKFWKETYELRQKVYYKSLDIDFDLEEEFDKYREGKLKDILPPINIAQGFIKEDELIETNFDLWDSKNPLEDYIYFDRPIAYVIGRLNQYRRLSSNQIRERLLYITSMTNVTTFFELDTSTFTNFQLERSYWRPERVVSAMRVLNPTFNFRIPYREYKEALDIKSNYFPMEKDMFDFLISTKIHLKTDDSRRIYEILKVLGSLKTKEFFDTVVAIPSLDPEGSTATADDLVRNTDFDEIITLSLIDIKTSDLGNELTSSHKRLRETISHCFYGIEAWYKSVFKEQYLVPVFNSDWWKKGYPLWNQIIEMIGRDALNSSGWFRLTKVSIEGRIIDVPEEIISIPTVRYFEPEHAIKPVEQIHNEIAQQQIAEIIVDEVDNNPEIIEEDLNEMQAFDLLEGMEDW